MPIASNRDAAPDAESERMPRDIDELDSDARCNQERYK